MALKRWIGPSPRVHAFIGGRDFGYVEKDQAIPVPDELLEGIELQPELWADGPVPKPAPAPKPVVAEKEAK